MEQSNQPHTAEQGRAATVLRPAARDREEPDLLAVEHGQLLVAHEDDPPHEGREPDGRVLVGVVFSDHDRMRDREKPVWGHSGWMRGCVGGWVCAWARPTARRGRGEEGRGGTTGDGAASQGWLKLCAWRTCVGGQKLRGWLGSLLFLVGEMKKRNYTKSKACSEASSTRSKIDACMRVGAGTRSVAGLRG